MTELETIVFNKKYDKICPICGKEYTNKRITTNHITNCHVNIVESIKEYKSIKKELSKKEFITCPICNRKLKEMARHLIKTHNISVESFKLKYPMVPLKIISEPIENTVKCDICGKEYKKNNALGLHYKNIHPEYFEEKKLKEAPYRHYTCPICSRKVNDIKQHIEDGHKIKWNIFCNKYNWDIKVTKYISEEYRHNLSVNKKAFYDSDKGIILKKIQSDAMLGDKNMACRPEIKAKISVSAIKRINSNPFFERSYGIKFRFFVDNNKYFARSFEEFRVMYYLIKNNILFKYEKTRLKYKSKDVIRTYILDFEIEGKYYEVKSSLKLKDSDNEKYNSVNDTLHKVNKHLEIVTLNELKNIFNFEINKKEEYTFCRDMLAQDKMFITVYTYHDKSRILENIVENYKTHKNIKYIKKESKCNSNK